MPGHVRGRGKRADGSTKWQARWRHPEDASDRNRRERTFRTKKEAERWIAAMDTDALRGSYADPRRGEVRFKTVAEEWKGTWGDLAPKTRVGYRSILNNHVLPRLGDKKIAGITTADLQEFANDLAVDRKPATVRRVFEVVSNVLRVAMERRYIVANPNDAVRLPRIGRRSIEVNPLTHPEIKALVAEVPEHYRLAVLLDAYTGLRSGELWALRRRNIDLLRNVITVENALKEVTVEEADAVPAEERLGGSLIIGDTKTYKERKIKLPAFLAAELDAHLSRSLPGGDGPEGFIFTTPSGTPIRHTVFYSRVFTKAVKRALPNRKLRFHDLRHTCASLLIEAGASILAVKVQMGHDDVQTTINIYGHLFPAEESRNADLLDAAYHASAEVVEPGISPSLCAAQD